MPDPTPCPVRRADWLVDENAIAAIRRSVFIVEQQVPEALEWEEMDAACTWFVAGAGETIVGIVRLTSSGRIGRMAVLPAWRRLGVGSALLRAALAEARRLGMNGVHLSAQLHAVPFYARFGFQAEGGVYDDAGIPHRSMTLTFEETP